MGNNNEKINLYGVGEQCEIFYSFLCLMEKKMISLA